MPPLILPRSRIEILLGCSAEAVPRARSRIRSTSWLARVRSFWLWNQSLFFFFSWLYLLFLSRSSFLSSASITVYMFLYSIYYFMAKTKMSGTLQVSFYFGYMLMFCFGVGLITGKWKIQHALPTFPLLLFRIHPQACFLELWWTSCSKCSDQPSFLVLPGLSLLSSSLLIFSCCF